jgi:hypothetical protein
VTPKGPWSVRPASPKQRPEIDALWPQALQTNSGTLSDQQSEIGEVGMRALVAECRSCRP